MAASPPIVNPLQAHAHNVDVEAPGFVAQGVVSVLHSVLQGRRALSEGETPHVIMDDHDHDSHRASVLLHISKKCTTSENTHCLG